MGVYSLCKVRKRGISKFWCANQRVGDVKVDVWFTIPLPFLGRMFLCVDVVRKHTGVLEGESSPSPSFPLNPPSPRLVLTPALDVKQHEIPKEPKVKEGRISLTFRQLVYD